MTDQTPEARLAAADSIIERVMDERDAAIRERDDALAQLHPIEWWLCVWCETKFPYDDGPDTLKAHSAICEKHPANVNLKEHAADLALAAARKRPTFPCCEADEDATPDGTWFTVDSLAAAVFAADDPHFRFATRGNCERFAAAIIKAAKEVERE